MKIAGLVIGIILSVLSAIGIVICLVLVSTTNGRVSFEEALMVAIPLTVLLLAALSLTIISAFFVVKAKRSAA